MMSIKWGVLGTGRIARAFSNALSYVKDAELYAVASRNKDKSILFANEFGFLNSYGSYEELFKDDSIDIVYIATPMASHYDLCISALQNGKNVFCEKSVTLNVNQLNNILDLARNKNLFFCEAMWMKCLPSYLKMKEWINNGIIGDICYIKSDFSNFVPFVKDDRLFRLDCGGGALLDVAVYPITLVHDLLGTPEIIDSSVHIRDGIDISETLIFKYKIGAFASIDCGFEIKLSNNAVISGTNGSIVFDDYFFCSDSVSLYDENRILVEHFKSPHLLNGYEYEIEEVHRCLNQHSKDSILIPNSETVEVMKIMDYLRSEWKIVYPDEYL